MSHKSETVTFTLTCSMYRRWVPHFLGMLQKMQHLGAVGSSRNVTIFADGDGDFRPRFTWDADLAQPVEPRRSAVNGDTFFDAG